MNKKFFRKFKDLDYPWYWKWIDFESQIVSFFIDSSQNTVISLQFWPTKGDGQSLYNQKCRPRSLKGRLSNRAFIHQWGQQNGGNESEIAFEAASGSFDQNYYHSSIGTQCNLACWSRLPGYCARYTDPEFRISKKNR